MMRFLLLVALLLAPRVAEACSCSGPRPWVMPGRADNTPAPTNTRIWVFIPVMGDWSSPRKLKVALSDGKKDVAVDRYDLGSGEQHVVVLRPRKPLAPNSKYTVHVAGDVAGKFETGDGPDTTPPSWNGLKRARWLPEARISLDCGGPWYVELKTDGVTSEGGFFGVWMQEGTGEIDYSKPPVTFTWATPSDFRWGLRLGHASTCSLPNFDFPEHKRIVIGLRLYDSAGNVADLAGEASVKITKPAWRLPRPREDR